MQSAEHMKRWLAASGRTFLVLNAADVCEALPFPGGHEALMQIIEAYRDHRRVFQTGRFERMKHPDNTKDHINVPIYKSEFLELDELDRCIRELVGHALALDPNWRLENAPL